MFGPINSEDWFFAGFYWVSLGFTEFYWVFLCFIMFHWISLGYTGFFCVLLCFTGFHWVIPGFTEFYWILLGFSVFYWVSLGFTGLHWVILGFTEFYWVLLFFSVFCCVSLGFTRLYWVLLGFTGFHWVLLNFTGIYWVSIGFIGFYRVLLVLLGFTRFLYRVLPFFLSDCMRFTKLSLTRLGQGSIEFLGLCRVGISKIFSHLYWKRRGKEFLQFSSLSVFLSLPFKRSFGALAPIEIFHGPFWGGGIDLKNGTNCQIKLLPFRFSLICCPKKKHSMKLCNPLSMSIRAH